MEISFVALLSWLLLRTVVVASTAVASTASTAARGLAVTVNTSIVEEPNQCNAVKSLAEFLKMEPNLETENSFLTFNSRTNIHSIENNQFELESNLNLTRIISTNCPSLKYAEIYTPTELITSLTAPCRYDRLQRPLSSNMKIEFNNDEENDGNDAVQIHTRAYINGLNTIDNTKSNQFTIQLMLEFRYVDERLAFSKYAPKRLEPIQGGTKVHQMIWLPHLLLANVPDTNVIGALSQNIIASIAPDGTVVLALSIQTRLSCSRNMKNFPFDERICMTTIQSWLHNSTDLLLKWENEKPLAFNSHLQLPGFILGNISHNASIVNTSENGVWHGAFLVNYSSISFTLNLLHDTNYYLMDYFIPSIIIVASSWVSFWIRADQTPSRTIFGCHTMLALITLSSNQIKIASGFSLIFEIWFLACVIFIFGVLVEFAFSNTILRRRRNVNLKKVNSKSILKSTIIPRTIHRKSQIYESKIDSIYCLTDNSPIIITNCVRFDENYDDNDDDMRKRTTALSLDSSITETIATSVKDDRSQHAVNETTSNIKQTFASMTPEEVSIWLDRKARFVFPLAFLIFNFFFWFLVLIF